MGSQVITPEEILTDHTGSVTTDRIVTDSNKLRSKEKKSENSLKGKPISGRFWKNPRNRFSAVVKTRGIKKPYAKKEALRIELKRVKEASRAIVAARQEEKQLKRERRKESLRRQEENRKKSEVVQVIKNTSKIKRMKKKQLRYIEKRDTNETQ